MNRLDIADGLDRAVQERAVLGHRFSLEQPNPLTPKSSWPWVRILLHSALDRPDTESVAAQYDRVIEALADRLPKVADHFSDRRPDLLAFTAFPKQICRQI